MSRAVGAVTPHLRSLGLALALATVAAAVVVVDANAQDASSCDAVSAPSDCVLPSWPDASLNDTPSVFGDVEGTAWVIDDLADVAPAGLDIQAVGVGSVDADAEAILGRQELLRLGKPARAVRDGDAIVVRVVLDRPADQLDTGHASVHIATDIDGSRSNNAPTAVAKADRPFAGMQDVYTVAYATTTGKTKLLDSDLSRGWYKDKDPFAASWATPTVLDILIRPQAFGEGFKVITYVSGPEGGYDSVTLGPGAIPVDGQVGLLPVCTESAIAAEPFMVRRLVENGQTLRNIEAPASWQGGATFQLDPASRTTLESLISSNDDDGDDRIGLPSTASLFENGLIIRQRPEIQMALEGGTVQLALELGLTRRGYTVLRDIDLQPTGSIAADEYLERAIRALVEATPSFRTAKKGGLLVGDGIGSCLTGLIEPPPAVELAPVGDQVPADGDGVAASA